MTVRNHLNGNTIERVCFEKIVLFLVLMHAGSSPYSQNFEGTIRYKTEFLNPMPNLVTEEQWEEMKDNNPDIQTMTETVYYKKGLFLKIIQCNNKPVTSTLIITGKEKIYTWKENADTGYFSNPKPASGSLITTKKTATISGIQCQLATLDKKDQKYTIYYNTSFFKADHSDFQGFDVDFLDLITKNLGCFPIRMEVKSAFIHMRKTVVDFNPEKPDDTLFALPDFNVLLQKE